MIKDFSLRENVYSGQVFRWDEETPGVFTGVVNKKIYRINENDLSVIENDPFLYEYFDLNTDYGLIKERLRIDLVMDKAISSCPGIRILNQDLWETIVSFIISQNNNIPRIKGLIKNLSKAYGEHIEGEYYDIPSPITISKLNVSDLMELRFGYRAEYLIETAKRYIELGYDKTNNPKIKMIEDANQEGKSIEEYLLSFKGIGPKVSNCISLFGLHSIDSFPIDVWVKRVMNSLYNIPLNNKKEMEEFAKKNFSPYAGIAQQYLFYYIRSNLDF